MDDPELWGLAEPVELDERVDLEVEAELRLAVDSDLLDERSSEDRVGAVRVVEAESDSDE